MEKHIWLGFAVYAGRVRLGTLERVWQGSADGEAVIAVSSSFPGVPHLLVRLADFADIRPSGRRIEVGAEPQIVLGATRARPAPSVPLRSGERPDELAGGSP
jgi:hypothetical protein